MPSQLAALALTGGGMKGRFTAAILADLATLRAKTTGTAEPGIVPLREAFDLIAGTSVGALIAAAIALGKNPVEIGKLIETYGPQIFPPLQGWKRLLHVRSAWFRSSPLEKIVRQVVGEMTLGALRHHLAIPAVNEATGAPVVYTTLDADHAEIPLFDAILASAAYSAASDRLFQQHPTGCSTGIRPAGGGGLRQDLHR